MQFKAFYNDWLDCSGMIDETGKDHVLNLNADFFKNNMNTKKGVQND